MPKLGEESWDSHGFRSCGCQPRGAHIFQTILGQFLLIAVEKDVFLFGQWKVNCKLERCRMVQLVSAETQSSPNIGCFGNPWLVALLFSGWYSPSMR